MGSRENIVWLFGLSGDEILKKLLKKFFILPLFLPNFVVSNCFLVALSSSWGEKGVKHLF